MHKPKHVFSSWCVQDQNVKDRIKWGNIVICDNYSEKSFRKETRRYCGPKGGLKEGKKDNDG